jgi:hypothetical protein
MEIKTCRLDAARQLHLIATVTALLLVVYVTIHPSAMRRPRAARVDTTTTTRRRAGRGMTRLTRRHHEG